MKKPVSSSKKNPFLFFGAGYGQYETWCLCAIRFEKEPSKTQREQIIKLCPPPLSTYGLSKNITGQKPAELTDVLKKSFFGRILILQEDQQLEKRVQAYYKNIDTKVYPNSMDQFEFEIEEWLKKTHEICPIQFAVRPKDPDGAVLEELSRQDLLIINTYGGDGSEPNNGMPSEARTPFGLEVEILVLDLNGLKHIQPWMSRPIN